MARSVAHPSDSGAGNRGRGRPPRRVQPWSDPLIAIDEVSRVLGRNDELGCALMRRWVEAARMARGRRVVLPSIVAVEHELRALRAQLRRVDRAAGESWLLREGMDAERRSPDALLTMGLARSDLDAVVALGQDVETFTRLGRSAYAKLGVLRGRVAAGAESAERGTAIARAIVDLAATAPTLRRVLGPRLMALLDIFDRSSPCADALGFAELCDAWRKRLARAGFRPDTRRRVSKKRP
jgi:hypothetical protein